MNRASDYGREIGRLAALMDKHPEAEDKLFDRMYSLMQPIVYADIQTPADALSALIVVINEADILASSHMDNHEAKQAGDRIATALYGIVAFLERDSGESRGVFGGNYLTLDSARDPRRELQEEAA